MTVLNSIAILEQSRQLIESTYWIKKKEIVTKMERPHSPKTPIVVRTGYGNNQDVVGVCSIGAMALAVATQEENETLQSFSSLMWASWETRQAGEALADVIRKSAVRVTVDDVNRSCDSRIAGWNDHDKRTREDVVKAFALAAASPIATTSKLWYPALRSWSGQVSGPSSIYRGICFATEEECVAFVEKIQGLKPNSPEYKAETDEFAKAFTRAFSDTHLERVVPYGMDEKTMRHG